MDPAKRNLLEVKVEEMEAADGIFTKRMGDLVEPRREFIEDAGRRSNRRRSRRRRHRRCHGLDGRRTWTAGRDARRRAARHEPRGSVDRHAWPSTAQRCPTIRP